MSITITSSSRQWPIEGRPHFRYIGGSIHVDIKRLAGPGITGDP
jgi:hypothetical protein